MRKLVALDHRLTAKIRMWGQPMYGFWKFMASQSLAIFVIVAAAMSWAHELAFWHFGLCFVTAYVLAVTLQASVRRQRPDFAHLTGYKMWFFSYSYPSAHAATSAAAAVSLVLMPNFASPALLAFVAATLTALALLIGVSRIVMGVHYLADIIFGWTLGSVVALGYVMIFMS